MSALQKYVVCRKLCVCFTSDNTIIQIFKVIMMYGSELFALLDMQRNVIHDSKKFGYK